MRLVSMALTGYYKTLIRPRTHRPLSMLKYDPVGAFASFGVEFKVSRFAFGEELEISWTLAPEKSNQRN